MGIGAGNVSKSIIINHWDKFQQYKDRRPNWIKLLIEIIDEFDADGNPKKFHKMPDSAKLTFILLACLRANYNSYIPYPNNKWLKTRLGIGKLDLQPVIDAGFISINTNPVQNCTELYEKDTPERENRDREQRERIETETDSSDRKNPVKANIVFDFEKRVFLNITEIDFTDWGKAYPAVSIQQEILKAAQWLLSNPKKRKSNYRKFLTNWFARTQDNGGTKGVVPTTKPNQPKLCLVDKEPAVFQVKADVYLCENCKKLFDAAPTPLSYKQKPIPKHLLEKPQIEDLILKQKARTADASREAK